MIDGVHFADHVVLAAVGVESSGISWGLREGAPANAATCKALLADLIARRVVADAQVW